MPATTITLPDHPDTPLAVEAVGSGRPVLLLHGGAGPGSVAGFGNALAAAGAHALTPTHPGFDGTPRPERLDSVDDLAALYRDLLDHLDLSDVVVVGSSVGGWIAARLALLGTPRVTGLVLVGAVGIEVPGHPVTDVAGLDPARLAELAFHDAEAFRIDPAQLDEAQRAATVANLATLSTYAGDMTDPGLRRDLRGITVPTVVAWGVSDGIVDPGYGRAYADAIPGSRFVLLSGSGHLPQIEQPDEMLAVVRDVAGTLDLPARAACA